MNYREGDVVRIKSLTWWNKQLKDKDGDITITNDNGETYCFLKKIANKCCGKIKIIDEVLIDDQYHYSINGWWFRKEWIEKKIDVHKTKLKQLKSEL